MKNFILLLSLILVSVKTYAVKVVAVINDEIITDYDIAQYSKVITKMSADNDHLKKSDSQFNKEIVQSLVDIYLFEHYANLVGIDVPDAQIYGMRANLEKQNGLKKGTFSNIMHGQEKEFNHYIKNTIIVHNLSSQIARDAKMSNWESNLIKNNINLEIYDFMEGVLLTSDKSNVALKNMQYIQKNIHDCDKLNSLKIAEKFEKSEFSDQVKDLDGRIRQALDLNRMNSIIYEDENKYHSYLICKYNSIVDDSIMQQMKNAHINKQVTQQMNKLLYQVKYNSYVKFI